MSNWEVLTDVRAILGEGPVWDTRNGYLYWVDIEGQRFYEYDVADNTLRTHEAGQRIGAVVPRSSGGFLAAMEQGLYLYDTVSGEWTEWNDTERERTDNRFNDGKCDANGRLWAGTMSLRGLERQGSLYRFNADGSARRMETEIGTSNGLAWSLDNKHFYYIDSNARCVAAYDYDLEKGEIGGRRTILEIPQEAGSPDGMSIDSEGMLWIAHWGGYKVARMNPATGETLEEIKLPAPLVTSCCFGGAEMDELYITTARVGLSDEVLHEYPLSGALFRVKVGVKGTASVPFGG
ncbi:SMP-30/gluconolactonase/LRE family protein [Paenibacillus sp. SYP-B4298]|uniref:SMP-30/gluconolactonase/LRE family protein n=1 Tax=Paenibacillus sp. SYP-B4298 TaxID=2996034 RepID=UPI0022DE48C4|nr:SMP-30/gluconolactonase/LRE family protein [Paenibacillus sp. SYP-B4298]